MRSLVGSDLGWVVELAGRRRRALAAYAPRFWRPAVEDREVHAAFLAGLIEAAGVVSVRTEGGFLIGVPDSGRIVVDDLTLEDDSLWTDDGQALLRHAGRYGPLRVVCPVPEEARSAAVVGLGLSVVETWWHRDLDSPRPASTPSTAPPPASQPSTVQRLTVEGAEGVIVAAPPVYDPGGPVLLVQAVETAAGLRAIEAAAGERGCVVAVVSHKPDTPITSDLLVTCGYRRTTEFFEGTVRP